ncbi:MAG: B12-binding domain-containing radical SAM protein [Nitrospiraceae bacterium]
MSAPMQLLLIIPPLTQLNTPYPSTAYLTGFLRARGYRVEQADIGIEMVLALFSKDGLTRLFDGAADRYRNLPGEARQMLSLRGAYQDSIDAVVSFLQGRDHSLVARICQGAFLPQGPRFEQSVASAASTDHRSTTDLARRLASLYLEDLADLVRATVAPQFALSRYAEQVGAGTSSFDRILQSLNEPPSLTDTFMLESLRRHVERVRPHIVGLTVPFPGNLYGAFRIAQALKAWHPKLKIVLGGGYANTELRRMSDPRVFDHLDFVTLDDGERPLLSLLEHVDGKRTEEDLRRTFVRWKGAVVFRDGCTDREFTMAEVGTPTYEGLPLDRYLSILDTMNPMHRLWSDGHWNKLTVAHGCYWKQCTFCDVGLDYIGRYEAAPNELLADRIETLIAETSRRGFHFVDEAAPPAALKALAITLLERGVTISWWGNIRFEKTFTPDLCRLLAVSGCIAVSAGLEAASDRLLEAMKKGITVDQTAQVAAAFRASGILVHAYLMYALPGETIAEMVEALERVRQLFAADLLQSAFWHKFTPTAHSPIGLHPAAHGIRITGPSFGGFAENDLMHRDLGGQTPDWVGHGLRAALLNYMEGKGLPIQVRRWFDHPTPRPTVERNWIARTLAEQRAVDDPQAERRLIWIGGKPVVEPIGPSRRRVILPNQTQDLELWLSADKADWLLRLIHAATPAREKHGEGYPLLRDVRNDYPVEGASAFDRLLRSQVWAKARSVGLLLV